MNVMVPIGIRVCRSFCAVMIGPIALVAICLEKLLNDLNLFNSRLDLGHREVLAFQWPATESTTD